MNQLFFEITPVCQRYGVTPYQYRFDGFEAICGGARHARRAVMCGLHLLLTLAEINRPRRVLELPEVHVSIRVSSGRIIIGKVGTYRKLDFVATGMATKLASRIPAVPDVVTVSEETHRLTQQHFSFDASSPRMIELPELGCQQYWIVENSNERLDLNTRISIGDETTV